MLRQVSLLACLPIRFEQMPALPHALPEVALLIFRDVAATEGCMRRMSQDQRRLLSIRLPFRALQPVPEVAKRRCLEIMQIHMRLVNALQSDRRLTKRLIKFEKIMVLGVIDSIAQLKAPNL